MIIWTEEFSPSLQRPLILAERGPPCLISSSSAATILLGWPDTDDKRGIDFRVFDLHIFHNHAVDTDDIFAKLEIVTGLHS